MIDGVADSENYYAGLSLSHSAFLFDTESISGEWSNNLRDTEKVWSAFLTDCVAAGPAKCPFFASTAAEIQANVDHLYASLRTRPIPVRTATSYGVVDYDTMRNVIFQTLYTPYAKFPALAQALAELSAGNATGLYEMSKTPQFKCNCDPYESQFENVNDGGIAVRCNDGKRISPDYEDVLKHYQNLLEHSSWADVWMETRVGCM